ncbi:MAG: hypothetical protein EPN30_04405 [Actinomycetota bacterium]|nr:MAG: hypothetical protein EPN30_04405 [Actinomycetota bacterium]
MPRSSTRAQIWGDIQQFDTRRAVIQVIFYYLLFVVVTGAIASTIISEILVLIHASDEFHWAIIAGFGIPLFAALVAGFRAGSNGVIGLDLQRLSMDTAPGLMNLTEGLCLTMGIDMPRVLELKEPQLNIAAFSVGNTRSVLVVTSGALDAFTRLEFEGLIARELVRARSGQIFFEARIRALQRLVAPLSGFIVPRRQGSGLTARLIAGDLGGVYFTRYPVAMISAFEKMERDPNAKATGSSLRRRVLAPYWAHPELENAEMAARIKELNSY